MLVARREHSGCAAHPGRGELKKEGGRINGP